MPYIKQDRKKIIFGRVELDIPEMDDYFSLVVDVESISNAGELNFAITSLVSDYFHRNGGRYQQINDILGALEGAKLEFYRRLATPYEDQKIKENGDVY